MSAQTTKVLTEKKREILRFFKKQDFLDRYLPDVGAGGFQWKTQKREIGEIIHFEISFVGYDRKFLFTGHVVWGNSRPPMRPHLAPGVGIEFDPADEKTLKELIRFLTSDEEDEILKAKDDRRNNRIRVALECDYLFQGRLVRETLSNISSTGLQINTHNVLAKGTQFIFFLYDNEFLRPLVLEGLVVWAEEGDIKPGLGVQFLFDSRKHKAEVEKYVNGIREQLSEE